MATKKIYLLEYLTAEGWFQHVEGISTLLLWGLLYIILLTPLSFAFSRQTVGQSEHLDVSLSENGLLASSTDYVPGHSYAPAFPPGVFILLIFHEYLRSRIGEKRLADPNSILTNLYLGAPMALFYSAVFYFAWDRLGPRKYFIQGGIW